MAKNVTIAGSNYNAVPAVQIPLQGGGTATFTDVADTTAIASDVASGKYFYTSSGTKTQGSATIFFEVPLQYNSSTGNWEPTSHTLSQIQSAANAGLIITTYAVDPTDVEVYSSGYYDTSASRFDYTVFWEDYDTVFYYKDFYFLTSDGITNWLHWTFLKDTALQTKVGINPLTSSQTITADSGYGGLSSVQINAMPTMTLPTSASSTASGTFKGTISRSESDQYLNIPTGYNSTSANYKIAATPNMTLPTSASSTASGTFKGTISRSESDQYLNIPTGYNSTSANYKIAATPNMTLPTATSATSTGTHKGTINRSTSDQYLNIPTGYNGTSSYYKISAVADGTAGTPTATKGTVSNHSVSVTPSVTNTTGYITGSTKTGTAVSVSASELVSGNLAITQNGTNIDVANYSTVSVNVQGGGGTGAVVISDTTDSAGGTIREITGIDISDTTATASDVATGKYFYTASGVKTQGTASGGGGGLTTIASGSFDGTDAYDIAVPVGTRMPKTDFWIKFIAKSDSEFTYDTNYKHAYIIGVVFHEFGHFDLSSVGDGKQIISDLSYNINNGGTITSAASGTYDGILITVRNGSANNVTRYNNFRINRKSDHFEVRLYNSNSSFKAPSTITYDYEVVYFGSNPSTDIVTIS